MMPCRQCCICSTLSSLFPLSMKPFALLSLLCLSLGLAACSPAISRIDPALLDNPLFAEWYYGQLQENMMSMQIQNNPMLKDDAKKSIVIAALKEATEK